MPPPNPFDYFSPWAPAPIRSALRTYAQYVITGLGQRAEDAITSIVRRFAVSAAQANNYVSAALNFNRYIQDLNEGRARDKIPRQAIPRNANLPEAYRVIANNCFRHPDAEPRSDDPDDYHYETVVLDFDHNPDLGEIRRAAADMHLILDLSGSPKARKTVKWIPCGMDIIGVERRT